MNTERFLTFYKSLEGVLKDIKKKEMSYMSEYGLRSVHMGCLIILKRSEKGMTISQLARTSNTDKALISRVIKELVLDEFVAIENTEEDKSYNKKYYLTEKGEKIVFDIDEDMESYMARARIGIPEEDMLKFYETLSILSKNISSIADNDN